jgi:adenylate kinase family enzyme
MERPGRVHVVGASGAGTTTLGRALARRLGAVHLDTDDYFWRPTEPPFEHVRPVEARHALLGPDLARHPRWVLSGSLCGWGDVYVPRFDLVVFLTLPPDERMRRLRAREGQRYGDAVAPGGSRHAACEAFLAWAAAYDAGGLEIRSLALHEAWLAALPCPVLRLSSLEPVHDLVEHVARGG